MGSCSDDEANWPVLVCPESDSELFSLSQPETTTMMRSQQPLPPTTLASHRTAAAGTAAGAPIMLLQDSDEEVTGPVRQMKPLTSATGSAATSRKRSWPAVAAAGGGSRFVACPLCCRSFHSAVIEAHAADCDGRVPSPAKRRKSGAAARVAPNHVGPPASRHGGVAFGAALSPVRPTPPMEESGLRNQHVTANRWDASPSLSPPQHTRAERRQTAVAPSRTSLWKLASQTDGSTRPEDFRTALLLNAPAAVAVARRDTTATAHGGEVCQSRLRPLQLRPPPQSALMMMAHENPELPGLILVPDFISEEEEEGILAFLDSPHTQPPWKLSSFNGRHLGRRWGVGTKLGCAGGGSSLAGDTECFSPPTHPMPELLRPVIVRMRERVRALNEFRPNEANAIEYRAELGHFLAAHCDDRRLSGAILVNLSLAGDAVMTYQLDQRPGNRGAGQRQHKVEVKLPRRSLQVQSGKVRYSYRHGIARDGLPTGPGCRRISLTFRQNKFDGYHC